MNKIPIIIFVLVFGFTGLNVANAEQWFVIKDKNGITTVSSGVPSYGWDIVEGPFVTKDAAERASGVGSVAQQKGHFNPYYANPSNLGSASDYFFNSGSFNEDPYWVIRNREGQVSVSNQMPSYGWYSSEGPFATADEATRAMGTGAIGSLTEQGQRPVVAGTIPNQYAGVTLPGSGR
jgi:hypothetical protein